MKTILISQYPLPYDRVASWPKMYDYYLAHDNQEIDLIICPITGSSNNLHKGVEYALVPKLKSNRLSKFFFRYKYITYLKTVEKLALHENKLIVKIIDSINIINELHEFLEKKRLRAKVTIIFFIHGFSYYLDNRTAIQTYSKIDHLVYLTKASYLFEKNRYSYIQSQVHFLSNGVDSNIFNKPSPENKYKIKANRGLADKIVYLWVSQDKPKKGLHILIKAWKSSSLYHDNNCCLLIVGTDIRETEDKNIHWLGKIPNNSLPSLYQATDYYLFTSLVHEGTGLSLIEAIKCGCTCFCSNITPLNEVTHNGKFGYLVDYPHTMQSWIEVLESTKLQSNLNIDLSKKELDEFFDLEDWCKNMNKLLRDIKQCEYF